MKTLAVISLGLLASLSHGQELPELLQPVDAYKTQRLIEYNSSWLQAELYSAKRFRIVSPDSSLLLKDDDFTVTPFDDVPPIHVTQRSVQRWEDSVAWNALLLVDLPPLLQAAGAEQTALLSMMSWDVDSSGSAVGTSEARHNQLRTLKQRAFYSVRGTFELFPDIKYALVPLKYTPKYALVYEIDPEKQVLFTVDRPAPGEVDQRTPAERARLADYENFIRSLTPEENVPVVEDVQ